MTAPQPGPAVGSLADEAGQLIDAVTSRLTRLKSEAAAGPPVTGAAAAEPNTAAVHTCVGWCPICRGADLLRGDRSEISEKLVDTALLVLTTLRSLIPEQPPAAAADGSSTTDPDDRPGVERIDIR